MPDFAVRTAFTAVDKISPAFSRMGNAAETFTKKTSGLFAGLAGQLGIFGGFALAAMGMKKIVSEAANFENSVANFTTLLGGSQSEAEKLVNTLQVLGAETPFQFSDLSDATQRLLGFGVATKDTVAPTLRMLGDLAQGNAEKLQGISLVYGQIMAGGKMMGQDFNQLINQGVPIAQGLAKVWGVDVNEAIKRVKQNGPVAAKDVQAAMIQMTSAGGMFYQGMMRSSKTLTGLWSTFMDSISMTASVIGQELLPYIKEVVVWATDGMTAIMNFTKENKQLIGFLIKSIPWVVGGFITWKFALLALQIPMAINTGLIWGAQAAIWAMQVAEWAAQIATWALTASNWGNLAATILVTAAVWAVQAALWAEQIAIWAVQGATWAMTAAQWALNAAFDACPIVWIIALIVLLVAAVAGAAYAVYKNWEPISEFFSGLWDGIVDGFNAAIDWIVAKFTAVTDWVANKWGKVKRFFGFANDAGKNAPNSGGMKSPNESGANLRAGNTNVNIYSNGTEAKAEVTPRRGATVNMNRLGYQQ